MKVAGALMGYTPRQVGEMRIDEFQAISVGYSDAHNPKAKKKPKGMSEERLRALGIEGV